MRGDDLRDKVAKFLSARYGNAKTEAKVSGKDADILFKLPYPGGRPMNIAVECKDWGGPLRSSAITQIYSSYGPAFESNSIDSLWIIAPHPIRAEQRETID